MNYELIIGTLVFMMVATVLGLLCQFVKRDYEAAQGGYIFGSLGGFVCFMVDLAPVGDGVVFAVLDAWFATAMLALCFWCMRMNDLRRKAESAWLTDTTPATVDELKATFDRLAAEGMGTSRVVLFTGNAYHFIGRNVNTGKPGENVYIG